MSIFNNKTAVTEFEIGKKYFIRTISYHYVGEVIKETNNFISLVKASWIADSGRFYDAMKEGIEITSSSEIEPYPVDLTVKININSIVDFCEYKHKLPIKQK